MLWPSKASALLSCSVSASNLVFGSFNPLTNSSVTNDATITVTCNLLSSYTITLPYSSYANGSQRRMVNGGNYLKYDLYTDPGYNQIWDGSHTEGGAFLFGGSKNHKVYARILLAGQLTTAVAGSYSDSITVILTYN